MNALRQRMYYHGQPLQGMFKWENEGKHSSQFLLVRRLNCWAFFFCTIGTHSQSISFWVLQCHTWFTHPEPALSTALLALNLESFLLERVLRVGDGLDL